MDVVTRAQGEELAKALYIAQGEVHQLLNERLSVLLKMWRDDGGGDDDAMTMTIVDGVVQIPIL